MNETEEKSFAALVRHVVASVLKLFQPIGHHPIQKVSLTDEYRLIRLGSSYGGKTLIDDNELRGCTIISAGMGEDASFDVEFATKFNAKVIIVDPTPRAIAHFESLISRNGKKRSFSYTDGGSQRPEAYDMSNISIDSLSYVPKALWNDSTTLRFFSPSNPEHVSHSISNYQNRYRNDTDYIEVESTTLSELMTEYNIPIQEFALLKIDIEGAEIEVLNDMITNCIYPKQILVEFDELLAPSRKGYKRISRTHDLLVLAGYRCIFTDGQADFLYVRENSFKSAT